jgi:hypothetical protein
VARSRLLTPVLAPVALAVATVVTLSGCGQMAADLGQQWVQVTFSENATFKTIQHVTDACSHVPNATPYPLPKQHTALNLQAGVRYNTTNATDANIAELQECLQKFPVVQGFTPGDTGDEGD